MDVLTDAAVTVQLPLMWLGGVEGKIVLCIDIEGVTDQYL
jgi:hypothetical protein